MKLTTEQIALLRQLETSYPNIFDTDQFGITDANRDAYIRNMLMLERFGLVESGLIKALIGYVISNPRLTVSGKAYLDGLR